MRSPGLSLAGQQLAEQPMELLVDPPDLVARRLRAGQDARGIRNPDLQRLEIRLLELDLPQQALVLETQCLQPFGGGLQAETAGRLGGAPRER
jgi:hypothetical protein